MVWGIALLIFVLGLPSMMSQGMIPALNKLPFYQDRDFLTFVADMCDISLTVGGCLMCIFIRNRYKLSEMNKELSEGNPTFMGTSLQKYLNITIGWICPIILGIMSVIIILEKFFGLENLMN